MRILSLFLAVFFWLSFTALADGDDSTHIDSARVMYISMDPSLWMIDDTVDLDLSMDGFGDFSPLNDLNWFNSNGVTGGWYQSLWMPQHLDEKHPDYFAFFSRQDHYLFFRESMPLFRNSVPFTSASYSSGPMREQFFELIHAQPLSERLRLTIDYRLISSPGFYKNQKTSLSNFNISAEYLSKNGFYRAMGSMILNRINQQENGGIASNMAFLDSSLYDRQITYVNLLTAQNRNKQNDYFIQQEIVFNRKKAPASRLFINHVFNIRREWHVYEDTDPLAGYYPVAYDSLTYDSVFHHAFENTLQIGNRWAKHLRWYAQLFISDDDVYIANSDSSLIQKVASIGTVWHFSSGHFVILKASSDVFPFGGDHDLHFSFGTADSLKWQPFLNASYCLISPSIYYERYKSNHLQWNNVLLQTKTLRSEAGLNFGKHHLSVFVADIENYTYFFESAVQQGGEAFVFGALYQGMVKFGRFKAALHAAMQDVRNAQYLNLPPWFIHARISMTNNVFKRALKLETGIDVRMYGSYFADAYNPVLQSFYPQIQIKTGGFVYPGLFVHAQIKRMRIFVELINVSAGLLPINYWQVPGYPLPDRSLRFGLNWTFFN